MTTRRVFLAGLLSGCGQAQSGVRLRARPVEKPAPSGEAKAGATALGLRAQRDVLLYLPKSVPDPAPLMVYLHGATGGEQQGIRRLGSLAEEFGFLLLSPASEETTWDAITSGYGRDVRVIDQALTRVFSQKRVDPRKIAVSGFSDGASYGLGLGISNGDLFGAVMAFSPGFIPPGGKRTGAPRMFISHGRNDQILPFEYTSGRLVPQLKRSGYDVTFRDFDGPHTVPPEIARAAVEWWLK
jgi:phospholipase/carboxylesterase